MRRNNLIIFFSCCIIYVSVSVLVINKCYEDGMTPQYVTSLIFASIVIAAVILEYYFRSGD